MGRCMEFEEELSERAQERRDRTVGSRESEERLSLSLSGSRGRESESDAQLGRTSDVRPISPAHLPCQ